MKRKKDGKIALLILALLIFFSLASVSTGGQVIVITAEGICREFAIGIATSGLEPGCWDVKIEIPGDIYHENLGKWRSSFYYVEKALCSPENEFSARARLDTDADLVDATVKLRMGTEVLEKDFSIMQGCPEPLPEYWSLLIAFVVILIFGYSLTWWWKRK